MKTLIALLFLTTSPLAAECLTDKKIRVMDPNSASVRRIEHLSFGYSSLTAEIWFYADMSAVIFYFDAGGCAFSFSVIPIMDAILMVKKFGGEST